MKFRFLQLFLIVIFGLFFASRALAVSPSSIVVNVSPQNPAPYENVDIDLASYAANLDTVTITWLVDGKTIISGVGKKSFSVTAGAAGSQTNVVASIAFPDGVVETRVAINPGVLVVLWQATDSFVPPFYKGKALPTTDSEVKVVAMPEMKSGASLANPKNMSYVWRKDYSNDQDASGYGKQFYLYTNDYLDGSNNVGVTASTINGQSSSGADIAIGTITPQISFYKKDDASGINWGETIESGHTIQGNEILVAIPYFISPKNIQTPTLAFTWSINGNSVSTQVDRKNLMPLKVQAGTSGTSSLNLNIENQYKIFETANKQVLLNF